MGMLPTMINVLQILAALGGWIVALAFIPFLMQLYREGDFSERFWFTLGILVGWGGTGVNRTTWELQKALRDTEYALPQTTFELLLLSSYLMILIGMLLHVRTVTERRYGEKFWAGLSLMLLTLSGVISLTY